MVRRCWALGVGGRTERGGKKTHRILGVVLVELMCVVITVNQFVVFFLVLVGFCLP